MAITLDQVFIPACQQMLSSTATIIEKAQAHEQALGLADNELLSARLADDMWPLPNQIQSLSVHSAYAIEQVKTGIFKPNIQNIPTNWQEMRAMLDQAQTSLSALVEGELDAIANNSVAFVIGGETRFTFTVQDFLLSFSMPNVHFHTTTAYAILRMRGVSLGKFDFLGQMRTSNLD